MEKRGLAFLTETVGDGEVDFYLGGYGAFDSFAYSCCKNYQKSHPRARLFFITPYITESYQKNQLKYEQLYYDGIIYPSLEAVPHRFAIVYRNRWMVEQADHVLAYINHDSGGAYRAYRHALRCGKPVTNLGRLKPRNPMQQ